MIARTKTDAIVFGVKEFSCKDCRRIKVKMMKIEPVRALHRINLDLISGATERLLTCALWEMLFALLSLRKDCLEARNVLRIVNALKMDGQNRKLKLVLCLVTAGLRKTGLDKQVTRKDIKLYLMMLMKKIDRNLRVI